MRNSTLGRRGFCLSCAGAGSAASAIHARAANQVQRMRISTVASRGKSRKMLAVVSRDCKLADFFAGNAMNRADAFALLNEYTKNPSLVKHMLAVEAAMRAYARKLGQDEERWGVVGLMHDFEYERWPDPPNHPL